MTSKEFSEEGYKLTGQPKDLYSIKGTSHIDLYDGVNLIPFDKITTFFNQNLK